MSKPKVLHAVGLIVSAALAIAMALEKARPQWAAPLAVTVALLTDVKKLVELVAVRAAAAAFTLLFLGAALYQQAGCAHVAATAKACVASSVQVDQVFTALNNPSTAEAIAAVDALGFLACATKSAVDEIIDALSPHPDGGLVAAETENSPVLANALAWRTAHPGP